MGLLIIGFTSDVVLNYFLSIMFNMSIPIIGGLAVLSMFKR